MSSPTPPAAHAPPPPNEAKPRPAQRDTAPKRPHFRSYLLSDDAQPPDESTPASFNETGVFGRDLALEDARAVSAPAPRDAQAPQNTATSGRALGPDRAQDIQAATTNAAASAHAPRGAAVAAAQHGGARQPRKAATVSAANATLQTPTQPPESNGAPGRPAQRVTRSTLFAAARASAVNVAIHALDQGLAVYARVGRMNATEREQLRQAVRRVLAEHGVRGASIVIDGDTIAETAGTDQWRP